MTKIREVYQAIVAQAVDGVCQTTRSQLARQVGISVRHLHRLTQELQEMGVIQTTAYYSQKGKRAGVIYQMIQLEDIRSPLDDSTRGHQESFSNSTRGHQESFSNSTRGHQESFSKPINGVKGLQESFSNDMNHDDDDKEKSSHKYIITALDFLDLNGRLKLAKLPHVTPGLAEHVREYVEHLKATRQWKKGSPGRVYRLIEANEVPTQFEMPAAIAELPQPKIQLGHYTPEQVTEINRTHPLAAAGLVFGQDGKWR